MALKLARVIVEINRGCNQLCRFCPLEEKKGSLPLSGILSLVESRRCGAERFRYLGISGGEPFLHSELPEIVSRFCSMADEVVLSTNGTLKIPDGLVQLGRLENLCIQVNVPSINAKTFAGITGRNLKSAREAVSMIAANSRIFRDISGLGVFLLVALTEWNSDEKSLRELIGFADSSGFRMNFFPAISVSDGTLGIAGQKVANALFSILPRLLCGRPSEVYSERRISIATIEDMRSLIEHGFGNEEYITMDGRVSTSLFHAYLR